MIRCIALLALCGAATAQISCGRPSISPDATWTAGSRIVGGEPAQVGAFPFISALVLDNGPEYYPSQFCGSSIIGKQWILTAGHCLHDMGNDEIIQKVKVIVGVNNLLDATKNKSKIFDVIKVVKHPQYDPKTTNNDIALLKLARPLTYDRYIQPICLPSHVAHDTKLAANIDYSTGKKAAVVAGWGLLREQEQPGSRAPGTILGGGGDNLNQVFVDVFSDKECSSYLTRAGLPYTDKMICAGFPQGGKDSCQGDSGGPLVAKDKDGHWEQAGIVSFGAGCARAGLPGVYTNLWNMKSWVQSNAV